MRATQQATLSEKQEKIEEKKLLIFLRLLTYQTSLWSRWVGQPCIVKPHGARKLAFLVSPLALVQTYFIFDALSKQTWSPGKPAAAFGSQDRGQPAVQGQRGHAAGPWALLLPISLCLGASPPRSSFTCQLITSREGTGFDLLFPSLHFWFVLCNSPWQPPSAWTPSPPAGSASEVLCAMSLW